MHRLFNLILLVRPHNVAAAVLSVAVGYGITAGGLAPWLLLAGVATATAGGNVINDLEDRDIDGINRPSRPLPSGALSPVTAWVVYLLFVLSTILLIVRLPVLQAAWIGSWVLLLQVRLCRIPRGVMDTTNQSMRQWGLPQVACFLKRISSRRKSRRAAGAAVARSRRVALSPAPVLAGHQKVE